MTTSIQWINRDANYRGIKSFKKGVTVVALPAFLLNITTGKLRVHRLPRQESPWSNSEAAGADPDVPPASSFVKPSSNNTFLSHLNLQLHTSRPFTIKVSHHNIAAIEPRILQTHPFQTLAAHHSFHNRDSHCTSTKKDAASSKHCGALFFLRNDVISENSSRTAHSHSHGIAAGPGHQLAWR